LTEPEIRRMLIAIVWPKMNEPEKTLLWSFWRRRHQAVAKYYHYKKRHSHPIGNQTGESSSKIAASELHYNRKKIGVTHEAN